ncbi:MAG: S8 family serine peptidase, partial [Caldilinea sp.]
AWELQPASPEPGFTQGQRRGKGVRVGHPDSGYRRHPDMFAEPPGRPVRVLTALERDFIDNDKKAENNDGGHGLNTAGVLMSSDETGFVVGAAPEAEIVPLRVTKPRFGVPAPVLFDSGVRNLRDAIRYAVDQAGCHVVSISLGWFGNWSLHQAIREAVAKNVIVIAASGNYVPMVVWPAAYPEVIAVAGCDAERRPWSGASTGPQVDVSGPAARVWVAGFSASGVPSAGQSDGTSFATATLAGIAALWLAYHGRDYLLHRYRGAFTLTGVFRHIVHTTCDPFAFHVTRGYGAGIYNARRILSAPLPTIAELQIASPVAAAAAPRVATPVDTIASAFPEVPEDVLRMRLAALLQVPESELDARLAGVEDELLFQVVTNLGLRNQLGAPVAPVEIGGIAPAAAPVAAAHVTLVGSPLSSRLRERIG